MSCLYCGRNDEGILIYEDEGFSGGNMERPQFNMMAEARAKKFSAIVCYCFDCISRNIGDFAKLIEELDGLVLGNKFIDEKGNLLYSKRL